VRIRLIVGLLVASLVIYFWLLTDRAVALISSGSAAGIALGIGVLLLPILGVVVVVFELRFGWQTEILGRRLDASGGLPDDSRLPRRPSGRVDRDAADAYFEVIRVQVEAAPEDWRGWYRLGHAYDLAGDRKRARSAMRQAIELARAADGSARAD
jgi:cytochrome c-type biogenesis protein CcmH/NrfG